MTDFQKQFANKLKEIRIMAGLSQEQLTKKLDVATKTVSYRENGHNAVTFNKIPLIANALGCPYINYLYSVIFWVLMIKFKIY